MNQMKILITGGSGLLGEKISETLTENGDKVFSGYFTNTPKTGTPIQFDIRNNDQVQNICKKITPDVIIHSAAVTNVEKCEVNRENAWKTNVKGTKSIVECANQKNIPVVYISTDYVFSGEKGNYKEGDTTNPINYYGETKLLGEALVTNKSINNLVLRPSVIYGSQKGVKTDFAQWILTNLKTNKTMEIVTDQIVSPTITTDLAIMIKDLIERSDGGIYHTSGATPITRYDFAVKLAAKFGYDKNLIKETTCSQMNWKASRPTNSSLNIKKISKSIGRSPWNINKAFECLAEEMDESN